MSKRSPLGGQLGPSRKLVELSKMAQGDPADGHPGHARKALVEGRLRELREEHGDVDEDGKSQTAEQPQVELRDAQDRADGAEDLLRGLAGNVG